MSLFSKPIAAVYVDELRRKLEPTAVPMFTPDTSVDVGDYGTLEGGRFLRRGNVKDARGVDPDPVTTDVGAFDYASHGKVSISPSVSVPSPTGGTLLESTISFSRGRAVVAAFKAGVERAARDADAFGTDVLRLWYRRQLPVDRVVVWSVRRAAGGTVIVSQDGGNAVTVTADSTLLAAAGITVPDLALGVDFTHERKATWKMSDPDLPMVVWMRLFRLSKNQSAFVDAFGFERGPQLEARIGAESPTVMTSQELLAQLE